ncbi:hypothetical protein Pelo_4573 [Pelomyxa schiedti]|nr:hypothetical protein Pelo_4573 [Pelomyxa schiedti]
MDTSSAAVTSSSATTEATATTATKATDAKPKEEVKVIKRRTSGNPSEEEITCVVCFAIADDPIVLPGCNHVVCCGCVGRVLHAVSVCDLKSNMELMDSLDGEVLTTKVMICASCGAEGKVKPGAELEKNPLLTAVCAEKRLLISNAQRVNCSVCQEEGRSTAADLDCTNCDVAFCKSCWDATHRGGMKRHVTAVIKASRNPNQLSNCFKHPNEQCKIFCNTCKENICYICATVSNSPHHGHVIVPIGDAIEEAQKAISEAMVPLQEKKRALIAQKERIPKLMALLDERQKETEAEVTKKLVGLNELWSAFTAQLSESGKTKSNLQRQCLGILGSQLDSALEQLDTFTYQATTVLPSMDDGKMMSLNALICQISENMQKFSKLEVMDIPDPQLFLKAPDTLPTQFAKLLESCSVERPPLPPIVVIMPFSSFANVSGTDDLIISSTTTLTDENITKSYRNIVIKKGAVVTVSAWNGTTGGVARLSCFSFSLEEGATIDVSGKGYRGADTIKTNEQEGQASQGESEKGMGTKAKTPNGSGGGGGNGSGKFGSTGGGGGGYTNKGSNADDNKYSGGTYPGGEGGLAIEIPQDVEKLPLGSGGGAGHPYSTGTAGAGGNGGGVVKIVSNLAEINGTILSNGLPGGEGNQYSSGGGGGSGGAIALKVASRLVIGPTAVLTANGGKGGEAHPTCGNISSNGGNGSIGTVIIHVATKELAQMEGKITPPATIRTGN